MSTSEIGFLAIFAYALAFISQWHSNKHFFSKGVTVFLTLGALTTHGLLLHYLIDLSEGQNLAWTNLFSLLTWLSACIIFFASITMPVMSLNFLLYPATIIAISLTLIFHPIHLIITKTNPAALMHILLATLIVALLLITGIQAALLFLQQIALKQKKLFALLNILPPLDKMQRLLNIDMFLCFFGLTIFLGSAFFAFSTTIMLSFWWEPLCSLVLWLLFLLLLIGRKRLRWTQLTGAVVTCGGTLLAIGLFLTRHLG